MVPAVARGLLWVALVAVGLVAACQPPLTCTQKGCDDQLRVQLLGALPDSVAVSAEAPGGARWVVQCTAGRCPDGVAFFPFTPDSVTIEVHGAGIDIVRAYRPTYYVFRPNGAACPGQCRQATVEIQVG